MRKLGLAEALARRTELAQIWADGAPERLTETLRRHAAREGFRLLVAEQAGRLVGFGYGHLGSPGQWWRESVAAAMSPEQRSRWLGPEHFEFVELHVRPELRRRGIGSALHDAVLERLGPGTIVLFSTRADNAPTLAVARRKGYRVILEDLHFSPGDFPYCVLGRQEGGASDA